MENFSSKNIDKIPDEVLIAFYQEFYNQHHYAEAELRKTREVMYEINNELIRRKYIIHENKKLCITKKED